MAESYPSTIDSSVIDDNKSVQVCNTENSVIDLTISVNGKRNKRQMTSEQYRLLTDKLFEIEQIKREEYLIYEQINRLNAGKQHLQNLLNILHEIDSNDEMRNSRSHQRRLKKIDSNFHSN